MNDMVLGFALKYSSQQYNHDKKCDIRGQRYNKNGRKLTIIEAGDGYVEFIIAFFLVSICLENLHSKQKTSPNASLEIQPFLIITTYHNTMKSRPGNRDGDN